MTAAKCRATLALLWACLFATAVPRAAADVVVMSSGGYSAALEQLASGYERATGHHVRILEGPSVGAAPEAIPNRLARGERADLLIMADTSLDALIAQGVVRAGRTDLARSRIGMAVRAGQPKPDISTVEAFTRVLLGAKSIAYSNGASGTYIQNELYSRLGLEAQLKPKSRMIAVERIGNVVARGDAEIGFQQVSELLPISGIVFAGPIPEAVQKITTFGAGIAAAAQQPDVAREFLAFLRTDAAHRIVEATGLEAVK
jgi:molybdate transport system substrate-binding protein